MDYFESAYAALSTHDLPLGPQVEDLASVTLTRKEVSNALRNLDSHKATGPDDIPNIFFRNLSDQISAPLGMIFNRSIEAGVFPSQWKSSFVSNL